MQETLPEVARRQPEVLEDPAPMVLLGFGASTLDFEWRCHLTRMSDRWCATDGLHHGIAQTFRERGIAIDYPQLDVLIRRET